MAWTLRTSYCSTDAFKLALVLVESGRSRYTGIKRLIYLWRH